MADFFNRRSDLQFHEVDINKLSTSKPASLCKLWSDNAKWVLCEDTGGLIDCIFLSLSLTLSVKIKAFPKLENMDKMMFNINIKLVFGFKVLLEM